MKNSWVRFRTNRYYLTSYFTAHALVLLALIFSLLQIRNLNWNFSLDYRYLALFPLWVLFGIKVPVFMHNCMHSNFKSRWVNVVGGELSAFFALMSLSILQINHVLHHAHSDTQNDPHNPSNKNFLTFFFVSQLTGADIIEAKFLEFHGHSAKNVSLFKVNRILHYGSHFLRLMLWFLILGPNLFFMLYLPSFFIYSVAFAHVNYITHRTDQHGNVEIINKNDNFYYAFINAVGNGVYFHKNHHDFPKLINPMYLSEQREVV